MAKLLARPPFSSLLSLFLLAPSAPAATQPRSSDSDDLYWASVWLLVGLLAIAVFLVRPWIERYSRRQCPRCLALMDRVKRENRFPYLTDTQRREQLLGKVDYDVWVCIPCGNIRRIPYPGSGLSLFIPSGKDDLHSLSGGLSHSLYSSSASEPSSPSPSPGGADGDFGGGSSSGSGASGSW